MAKRILVAVDGTDSAKKAVGVAAALAKAAGVGLDILYVSYFDSDTDTGAGETWLPKGVAGEAGKVAGEVLASAQKCVPAEVSATLHRRTGTPAKEIMAFAGENDIETIVVGRRGLGLFGSFLKGSVSQELLDEAEQTVIVVR